jgi:hypothetical protein
MPRRAPATSSICVSVATGARSKPKPSMQKSTNLLENGTAVVWLAPLRHIDVSAIPSYIPTSSDKGKATRSPAISYQMRAAELCGYSGRTGQRWAAGEVPKAVEIMIRLMLETGCEHPEDLLSWARSRVKAR